MTEIARLESMDCWEEVSVTEEAFRRKRTPVGAIKKWKGSFCVRGDFQEGDFDYLLLLSHGLLFVSFLFSPWSWNGQQCRLTLQVRSYKLPFETRFGSMHLVDFVQDSVRRPVSN
jgi:hypothetical protein